MENCIFCQIIAGDIPSCKVYEDETVLAFLDISQTTPGHTLLIPKQHSRNCLALSSEEATTLFENLPKIARAVQTAIEAEGLTIIANNEEASGQTVFHTHIHLIPRYGQEDGLEIRYTTNQPDMEALEKLAKQIASEVLA